MDYKKSTAPTNTVTRNVMELCDETGNIYESVAIIAKRANQISAEIKGELSKKLQEFASVSDSLDEMLRTASRLKSASSTRSCPKRPSWPQRNLWKEKSIFAIPARRA